MDWGGIHNFQVERVQAGHWVSQDDSRVERGPLIRVNRHADLRSLRAALVATAQQSQQEQQQAA